MSRIFAVAFATILFAASPASAATHDRCVTGATIYTATEAPRAATVCITGGRISGIAGWDPNNDLDRSCGPRLGLRSTAQLGKGH